MFDNQADCFEVDSWLHVLGIWVIETRSLERLMGTLAYVRLGEKRFLRTARISEGLGFEVLHGIVDSLWLKKDDATLDEYNELCNYVSQDY